MNHIAVFDALRTPGAAAPGNGNLFRSLTLLAVTAAEQKGCELKDVLTAQEGQWSNFGMFGVGRKTLSLAAAQDQDMQIKVHISTQPVVTGHESLMKVHCLLLGRKGNQ